MVVPYDAIWPHLYDEETARITRYLVERGLSLKFEHSGSTSIPGLAAKPILDILAGRASDEDRSTIIDALQTAGYTYRGEQGIPGRDFFRRGDPRSFHLHLTTIGSAFWHDHLMFRDYLRSHQDALNEYARVKLELAEKYPFNREAYIEGKTAFVLSILERARAQHTRREPG